MQANITAGDVNHSTSCASGGVINERSVDIGDIATPTFSHLTSPSSLLSPPLSVSLKSYLHRVRVATESLSDADVAAIFDPLPQSPSQSPPTSDAGSRSTESAGLSQSSLSSGSSLSLSSGNIGVVGAGLQTVAELRSCIVRLMRDVQEKNSLINSKDAEIREARKERARLMADNADKIASLSREKDEALQWADREVARYVFYAANSMGRLRYAYESLTF